MYIIVLSNLFEQGIARTVVLDAQFNVASKALMNEVSIVQKVVGFGMKPLNFSVVDNHVVDSCGKFTRFGREDSKSLVVVARLISNGRTVGYRVVATNSGVVANLKLSDLITMCKSQNTPLTQNMMFRQGTLAEYAGCQIPTVEMPKNQNERIRHQMPVQQSVIDYSSQQPQPKPLAGQKTTAQQPSVQEVVKTMDNKQQREVMRAMNSGIDPSLIADKRLTPQQMRVLWMSKQWGCKSEVFKNPNLGVDVMKFYADRLYTDEMCDKCKPILEHPELPLSEVSELYLCAMAGMDVKDLVGKSATDIQIAHENATRDYWCENKIFGDDPQYYEKALRVAMEEG